MKRKRASTLGLATYGITVSTMDPTSQRHNDASMEDGCRTRESGGEELGRSPRLVSAVVPARNAADTLPQQLSALAAQTYGGSWEVVVVDNGSTDNTVEVALGFSDSIRGLSVVNASQRKGAGYARNIGARSAAGDLLVFCDADDIVEQDWLSGLVEAATQADAVGSLIDRSALDLPLALGYLRRAPAGSFAVWREVFEALGGFDPKYLAAEDTELSWRIQLSGFKLNPAPTAHMRQQSRTTTAEVARQFFAYGLWHAVLYWEYRDRGVPNPTKRLARRLGWLVVRLPYLLASQRRRRSWVRTAADLSGWVVGSCRHRALLSR